MSFNFRKMFNREKPIKKIPRQPQPKKKGGCKSKYREKKDGFDIEFSPECNSEERAEIVKKINERRNQEQNV